MKNDYNSPKVINYCPLHKLLTHSPRPDDKSKSTAPMPTVQEAAHANSDGTSRLSSTFYNHANQLENAVQRELDAMFKYEKEKDSALDGVSPASLHSAAASESLLSCIMTVQRLSAVTHARCVPSA